MSKQHTLDTITSADIKATSRPELQRLLEQALMIMAVNHHREKENATLRKRVKTQKAHIAERARMENKATAIWTAKVLVVEEALDSAKEVAYEVGKNLSEARADKRNLRNEILGLEHRGQEMLAALNRRKHVEVKHTDAGLEIHYNDAPYVHPTRVPERIHHGRMSSTEPNMANIPRHEADPKETMYRDATSIVDDGGFASMLARCKRRSEINAEKAAADFVKRYKAEEMATAKAKLKMAPGFEEGKKIRKP